MPSSLWTPHPLLSPPRRSCNPPAVPPQPHQQHLRRPQGEATIWLIVHLGSLIFIGLLGAIFRLLTRGMPGRAAQVSRLALTVLRSGRSHSRRGYWRTCPACRQGPCRQTASARGCRTAPCRKWSRTTWILAVLVWLVTGLAKAGTGYRAQLLSGRRGAAVGAGDYPRR